MHACISESSSRKRKAQTKRVFEEILMKGIFTKEWTGLKEATGVMGEPRIDSSEKLLPLIPKPKGARREFSQKLACESQG